jgi:Uncharacterised nucleotidyltransferase
MTTVDREIPQPIVLQATLRKITEGLAQELACPTQLAPDWSDFEWMIARAVAAIHGVSPLLARTLRWQGPAGWVQFLQEQRAHTAKRHARIEELLRRIDRRVREAGVAATPLKGVALHELGVYQAGDRPMADIDLLVRPADAEAAARLLVSLDYYQSCESWKEKVFTPTDDHTAGALGEHSNNNVKIELHERICEKLPLRITEVSELVFPARPQPGLNAYPSKASLMSHLLLHAAGAMAVRTLRLLHLHDIAGLSSLMTEEDWGGVFESGDRVGKLWWAFPPLKLTSRYFPSKIPIRVLETAAGACSTLLERTSRHRMLYDVSLSYPWVDAFPGIAWSQSIPEILRYAASRVWPGARHFALREQLAKIQPDTAYDPWTRLSQGHRILRWMTSRPTRAQTMHAVRAALTQVQ